MAKTNDLEKINWIRSIPFGLMQVMPLGILWTGITWSSLLVCVVLYFVRMFFITAGYHRYFAHRTYEVGRMGQFLLAIGGTLAAQKGPLWWASHHRHHHHYSDTDQDVHSPLKGFWWSHMKWITCKKYAEPRLDLIKDLVKFPELLWLDRHYLIPPTLLALACYMSGGMSMLFVGFFLSTMLLYHGTFSINSLMHLFGRRRYVTNDSSRNSLILALITCGEGWHNNHHYFPASVRQGFFWWEIDVSFYVLKGLEIIGLVKKMQLPSASILQKRRIKDGHFDNGLFHNYWIRALRVFPNLSFADAKLYVQAKQLALDEFVTRGRISALRLKKIVYGVLETAQNH